MRAMHPLITHRSLLRFALALVSVFAWVFFFQYFYLVSGSLDAAFAQTALLYALTAVTTALLTPYAARALRNGTRRAIAVGLLYLVEALIVAGSLFTGIWVGAAMQLAFVVFALSLGAYRALYWIPYTVERSGAGKPRVPLAHEVLIALAPAVGGLAIALSPTSVMWLFFASATLVALSLVSIPAVPDVPEQYSWGYRQTFHELLVSEHRELVFGAFLEGIIGAALLIFGRSPCSCSPDGRTVRSVSCYPLPTSSPSLYASRSERSCTGRRQVGRACLGTLSR